MGFELILSAVARSFLRAAGGSFRLTASVCAVLAILILSACNSPSQSFLLNGIGAELPARDVKNSTELQHKYFNYLCRQAGLPYTVGANGAPHCNLPLHDRGIWTLVVYQGMNDVDRRCDAYLQWLDNKKRSKEPLLSQVSTVRTATEAIIGFSSTNPVAAINIVGQAFQLLTDSIENYHSRLLLEVDSSTVNSIVLRGRHNFRMGIQNRQFQNRPEAEHVLRSYLRLCLPFAIETNINDYSTLGSLGVSPDGGNSINQVPIAGVALKPDTQVDTKPPPRPRPKAPGWEKVSSIVIDPATAKAIQKAICLTGSDVDGSYGNRTEAGLKIFESIANTKGFREAGWRQQTVELSRDDLNILRNISGCATGARNYLENALLTTSARTAESVAAKIREKYSVADETAGFTQLRSNIAAWRTEEKLDNGPNGMFAEQITPELLGKILPAF